MIPLIFRVRMVVEIVRYGLCYRVKRVLARSIRLDLILIVLLGNEGSRGKISGKVT